MSDVEETKQFILQRLQDLREVSARELVENLHSRTKQDAAVHLPPRRSKQQQCDGLWRRCPAASMIEDRLASYEERLATLEECFVHERGRGGRQRAARVDDALEQLRQAIGLDNVDGYERHTHAGTRDGAHPNSEETHAAIDPVPQATKSTRANAANTTSDNTDVAVPVRLNFDGKPYRMTGSVEDGLMTDVLQMLSSNQKTGCFSLFDPANDERFDLFFRDGEIVHTTARDAEGESAFFVAMTVGQERGYYGFLEGEIPDVPNTIDVTTQFLILEALRRIDEESGGDKTSKPAQLSS